MIYVGSVIYPPKELPPAGKPEFPFGRTSLESLSWHFQQAKLLVALGDIFKQWPSVN